MAFFNTPIAALLLSLSVVVFSSAAAYSTIAEVPALAPGLVSAPGPVPSDEEGTFDVLNSYIVPMEEQATDKQYLMAHMTLAANKVELFLSNEVEKKLSDPSTSESDKGCVSVCKEVYESAVDAMKTGMESLSSGDFVKAHFDIGSFRTNIGTCDDCFDGFNDFDGWAKGVGSDCLKKIAKYSNLN
ncbi:hypothetical protein ACS0TY_016659 [Phlomoides rotata]